MLTSPNALKVQDEFNRFLYKQLIGKLSKALMIKPQYVWEIKSSGVPELLKEFDMNWPIGENNRANGFLCINKAFANRVIHYSLGGGEKKYLASEHTQLTHMDTKILEKFFYPILEFAQDNLNFPASDQFLTWIDDPRLLPFMPPGKEFVAFEFEISLGEEIYPLLILSHHFEVQR